MTAYHLEHAWLGPTARPGTAHAGEVAHDVLVRVEDGRFTVVQPGTREPPAGAVRLPGLTLPGFADSHSHAFHRALRGRTQRRAPAGPGSFWGWREQMYAVAARLDPATYRELATAVFGELVAAGFTSVGEFHYLHHRSDGSSHPDRDGGPNAMGLALLEAARAAGIRLALLDTCYLTAGIGRPAERVQRRFSDGDVREWQRRADELLEAADDDTVIGAAVHSVRAVPLDAIRVVADWADRFEVPLHVHLSEQVAENEECLAAYGRTPTEVLDEAGAITDRSTVVHATHLTGSDVERIGRAAAYVCLCPTTERDLGDGTGPPRALTAAGARLTVGSDSHAVVDPFEELRAVELDERLVTGSRGHWSAAELLTAGTVDGHASLGFPDAGRIAVGQRADLVTLDLCSPRTAGSGPTAETAVFAASAADVVHVVAGGRVVARGTADERRGLGEALDAAVRAVVT